MSYSTLHRVYKTKAPEFAEYSNGWGSAPVLWEYLCKRYLHSNMWMADAGSSDSKLWKLTHDLEIPYDLRLCLAFTFDTAYCTEENLAKLADACEFTYAVCYTRGVSHWKSIATDLRSHKFKFRQIGVSLGCTSVSNPWASYYQKYKTVNTFNIFEYVPCAK